MYPRAHAAPVQHAVLPPAAPIIHRQAPNVAPGTESGSKPTPAPSANSGTKTDDKKNDSKKTSEDKSKDDKSKDDKKDNTEHTVAEDSTSANKDPDRDKAGDYSVSMKNKDPKIKDADKQVKSVKKKQNSSFVWIVVTVFIILGIIVAAVIFLYKRSQDS